MNELVLDAIRRRSDEETLWGKRILKVHGSPTLVEDIERAKAAGFDGIRCDAGKLGLLIERPFEAIVVEAASYDMPPLREMPWLKSLSVGGPMDMTPMSQLENLRAHWHAGMRFPADLAAMKDLALYDYGFKDLSDLAPMRLHQLHVNQGQVESLAGPHRFDDLVAFEGIYVRGLSDVSALSASTRLQRVRMENCKSLETLTFLAGCSELEHLSFIRCGTIPSLDFVTKLPRLRHLVFAGTVIADGDLSMLLGRSFQHLYFNGRKGYSHTLKQINASTG